ncbi:hypothetical protein BDF19DRAFT_499454 [Syncephalis fuscata]|nr:hypothetical protein BDF19DRAFT_499454 [Syncephalis fuscata]
MLFLKYQQLILLLFTCISIQTDYVCAKLIFYNNTSQSVPYNLTGIYLYPRSYQQHYEGVALLWNLSEHTESTTSCFLPSVNAFDPEIRNIADNAYKYRDFAIIINYKYFIKDYCNNKEQISQAIDELIRQLSWAGFPPIKLLILSKYWAPNFYSGYDYVMEFHEDIINGVTGLDSITISTTRIYVALEDMTKPNAYTVLRYTAQLEPEEWNAVLFSKTYIAYKWIYFTLVLIALLCTCARIIGLAIFKLLKWNLLLVAFAISIVYCIFFLIHLAVLQKAYQPSTVLYVYVFLAGIPFDIIILHWSIIGKRLFSVMMMIPFWLIIIIDAIVTILRAFSIIHVINLGIKSIYFLPDEDSTIESMRRILSWIATAVFGGFLLWFGFISYRLRKHSDGRRKFIQMACLTVIALSTYLVFPFRYAFYRADSMNLSPTEAYEIDFMFDTAYMVRALVFLSILGIQWPYPPKLTESEIREPLGGMTTIERNTNVGATSTYWQLTRDFTKKHLNFEHRRE